MDSRIYWALGLGGLAALLISGTGSRAEAAIQPTPEPTPTPNPGVTPVTLPPSGIHETGTQFAARVAHLTDVPRDNAALQAAVDGSTPSLVGQWLPVPVSSGSLSGTIYVSPDFFGVGTDADWIRWPMKPGVAQRLADHYDAVLPTRKMADDIYAASTVRTRLKPSATDRDAVPTIVSTNTRTETAIAGHPGLRDGHKKNILAADSAYPNKVIIYGALDPDRGTWPLQPYSGGTHSSGYEDYSHGIRLVARMMDVAGHGRMSILDVTRDPALAPLVSNRTSDRNTRYV